MNDDASPTVTCRQRRIDEVRSRLDEITRGSGRSLVTSRCCVRRSELRLVGVEVELMDTRFCRPPGFQVSDDVAGVRLVPLLLHHRLTAEYRGEHLGGLVTAERS